MLRQSVIKGKVLSFLTDFMFIAFVGWSLYGAIRPVETHTFRLIHLGFIFVLAALTYPVSQRAGKWRWFVDLPLALAGILTIWYPLRDLDVFLRRSTVPNALDVAMGIIVILLLVEFSRRIVGRAFTLVLIFFLLYDMFGYLIPGGLGHKGYGLDRIVGHMYMTLEGVLGVPLAVSASFVILFVVYGVFMDTAGAGKFWLELAISLMGRKSSSAGRGAILTTALLGGPQASGVATTMSVTPIMWPVLREAGYNPDMAAGLISAGGIGAVISPPLMGAAAFLIMQFLGVSFWSVVLMVLVPTILYYLGTFFIVEFEARKLKFSPPEIPVLSFKEVMLRRGYHLISLIVLVILLAMGRSPESAAVWAIVTTVLTSFLSRDKNEWLTPRRIVAALIEGGKNMIPVAVLLAAAGIIVGTFSLTGLGLKISSLIMALSGGNKLMALFLAFLTSLIIGLSLPITATYIMTVVMVAPALVKLGIPDFVAHIVVFYFAVLSEVSPPVGLSPSAAAAITGGNPFRAMLNSWKYCISTFLVPFMFSATPIGFNLLIVESELVPFLWAALNSVLAVLFISAGIVGHIKASLSVIERAVLVAVALLLVIYPVGYSAVGWGSAAAGTAVLILNLLRRG